MKKVVVSALFLLGSAYSIAQDFQEVFLLPLGNYISAQWHNRTDLLITNSDYCDYWLQNGTDEHIISVPGSIVITPQGRHSEQQKRWKYIFRGSPVTSSSQSTYYFPIKGRRTQATAALGRVDGRMEYIMQFDCHANDIVVATHSGRVCRSGSNYGIVVYHEDGTFAVYMHLKEISVKAGDWIKAKTPIGKARGERIEIAYLFLDKQRLLASSYLSYPYTHFIVDHQ